MITSGRAIGGTIALAFAALVAVTGRGTSAGGGPREATAIGAAAQPDAGAPAPVAEPCEEIAARVVARLGTPDDALSDGARDALFFDARTVGRREERTERADACRSRVREGLVARETCGRAEAAVAGGLAGAMGADPAEVRALVVGASPACAATFAEAAGFAADVDRALGEALLLRARRDPDPGVRRSAWLAFGSIGEIASQRGAARDDVRRVVEDTLAAELRSSRGEAHLLAAKAAGNAGCRSCAPALVALAEQRDASVRRVAVAAFRFHDDAPAAKRMCRGLEGDADSDVREVAAWALSFRTAHPAVRVPCLYRAAMTDPSARVRGSAVQALGALSDDLAPAYQALVALTGPEAPGDARELAGRVLATDPSRARRHADDDLGDFFVSAR